MNELLRKEDLEEITIEQFKESYNKGIEMSFTTEFSFEIIDKDDDESWLYANADVFRQGACQLFALALHRRYKYPVYELNTGGSHWYCKKIVGENELYVDVRGICDNIKLFTSTLFLTDMTYDTSRKYDIEQDVPTRDIDKLGLAFAEWIIQKSEDRYLIK